MKVSLRACYLSMTPVVEIEVTINWKWRGLRPQFPARAASPTTTSLFISRQGLRCPGNLNEETGGGGEKGTAVKCLGLLKCKISQFYLLRGNTSCTWLN